MQLQFVQTTELSGDSVAVVDLVQRSEKKLWSLPCLAQQVFPSLALAQKVLNNSARQRGYVIVYKGARYNKHHQKRLIRYGCDNHGFSRGLREQIGLRAYPNASTMTQWGSGVFGMTVIC